MRIHRLLGFLEVKTLLLAVFCIYVALCFPESARIDPSRLNIVTVVDPSSEEVLRDALTLIRSIRLFGGSLNNATITAYIPIDEEDCFLDTSTHGLLLQLASLGIEISYISQPNRGAARTLNKFEILLSYREKREDQT